MRVLFSVLLVLLNIQVVSAQVLLRQAASDAGHYIVAFKESISQNRTALRSPLSRQQYMATLKQNSAANIAQLKLDLAHTDLQVTRELWLRQSAAIQLSAKYLDVINGLSYVLEVRPDRKYQVEPQAVTLTNGDYVADDIARIDIDGLWSEGYKGQGVVVAILDTGVDVRHPDLKDRWRGGTNSWFDPNDTTSVTPTDTGHGTGVASVILGGNNSSNGYLGVAPEATWIAARVVDGSTTDENDIHAAFQWLVDPDNNASTDDFPDIVQNSWGIANSAGSCDATFVNDLADLALLGIDVVFAVGNSGGSASSYLTPSFDRNVISVGAISDADIILSSSGRGPDTCNSEIIPSLVAPGETVRVADIANSYNDQAGTSFSSPMVSGALALLRSKYQADDYLDYRQALYDSTLQLGTTSPNDDYGRGLVQASAAAALLQTATTATSPTVTVRESRVNFSMASYVIDENISPSTFSVTILRSGDISAAGSVGVIAVGGSAREGQDFQTVNTTVDFLAYESQKTFDVTLIDDTDSEGDESFTLQFRASVLGLAEGANNSISVVIKDDESLIPADEIGGSSFSLQEIYALMALLLGATLFRRYQTGR